MKGRRLWIVQLSLLELLVFALVLVAFWSFELSWAWAALAGAIAVTLALHVTAIDPASPVSLQRYVLVIPRNRVSLPNTELRSSREDVGDGIERRLTIGGQDVDCDRPDSTEAWLRANLLGHLPPSTKPHDA